MIPFNITTLDTNTASLDISCYISLSPNATSTINGLWLDLNDKTVYTIAAGSFEETSVQFRREEITNPFIEGTYVVNALRDNVMMNLVVRVSGERTYDVAEAVTQLTDALGQVNYKVMLIIDGAKWIYNCYAADYSVQTPRELLHSRMATVSAEIMRDPVVLLSEDL